MTDADVIDHEAFVLGIPSDPVHPGDGLQQVVVGDDLVQVNNLLQRSIETGDEHVVDDEDAHIPGNASIFAPERHLETLCARLRSNSSESRFRNSIPKMNSLNSDASILPRRMSAALNRKDSNRTRVILFIRHLGGRTATRRHAPSKSRCLSSS